MKGVKIMMKTIKQASEETGLSQYAIRKLILSNKIKYIRCGVKYMVNMPSLLAYCEGGEGD